MSNPKQTSFYKSVAWAVLAHALLIVALIWAWQNKKTVAVADDAAPATVSLWAGTEAAPAAAPPPPRPIQPIKPPQPKPEPKPEPVQDKSADIDTASKPQPKPKPSPKPVLEPPEKKPAPKKEEVKEAPKAKAEKPAPGKPAEKELASNRNDALSRLMKQAGAAGGSTTSSTANGEGKAAYKPSSDYTSRVAARIRSHTRFDTSTVEGNPCADIQINMSPDGTIIGEPRLIKSSGNRAWDEAALRAPKASGVMPRDPAIMRAPPSLQYRACPLDN